MAEENDRGKLVVFKLYVIEEEEEFDIIWEHKVYEVRYEARVLEFAKVLVKIDEEIN